jgi:hypothetical protein
MALFNLLSLNAVTGTGAGQSAACPNTLGGFTWVVTVTGSPTACVVNLEGSLDNVTFFTLDTCNATTSEMRHVINKSVAYLRANLATLTAGTAPTVTARIYKGE